MTAKLSFGRAAGKEAELPGGRMSHLGLGTSFCSCALASQALALPGDANEDRLQVGLIQSLAGQKKKDGSPTS